MRDSNEKKVVVVDGDDAYVIVPLDAYETLKSSHNDEVSRNDSGIHGDTDRNYLQGDELFFDDPVATDAFEQEICTPDKDYLSSIPDVDRPEHHQFRKSVLNKQKQPLFYDEDIRYEKIDEKKDNSIKF